MLCFFIGCSLQVRATPPGSDGEAEAERPRVGQARRASSLDAPVPERHAPRLRTSGAAEEDGTASASEATGGSVVAAHHSVDASQEPTLPPAVTSQPVIRTLDPDAARAFIARQREQQALMERDRIFSMIADDMNQYGPPHQLCACAFCLSYRMARLQAARSIPRAQPLSRLFETPERFRRMSTPPSSAEMESARRFRERTRSPRMKKGGKGAANFSSARLPD